MAVMKVCCGCMSTRSGTLAVLLLYIVAYIAGIIFLGIKLGDETIATWYTDKVVGQYDCKSSTNKDSWWCTSMNDLQYDVRTWSIVAIIVLALYLVFAIVALFGTSRGTFWPLLPWIILEFLRLLVKLVVFVMTVIVWAVYMGDNEDSSYIIATGVIGAAFLAFFFYLWLCVVSYFQLLREIDQIGNLHKVDDSPSHQVTPFVVEDYDKESPYDNMSEHTTKESLDDTSSIKSRAKSPIPDDVKTTNLEDNE